MKREKILLFLLARQPTRERRGERERERTDEKGEIILRERERERRCLIYSGDMTDKYLSRIRYIRT